MQFETCRPLYVLIETMLFYFFLSLNSFFSDKKSSFIGTFFNHYCKNNNNNNRLNTFDAKRIFPANDESVVYASIYCNPLLNARS